ncbi:alpha/beta hydrolase [Kribbella sp.]|uniref:alpha/beta fold hydrolase n=1 Tax=Kribbella sp. TaxID=1871183 RepID=UPI002D4120B6|nr:alpha/beta hydrolase [Kribbella sp.]HZX01500.1 alpha/beta hydrolase [Kribbella sp.]
MTTSSRTRVLPLVLGALAAPIAGAVVLLVVAAVVPVAGVFLGVGAVVLFVVTWLMARLARVRGAVYAAAGWSVLVALGFGLVFLRPFPAQPVAAEPAWVGFWSLPDGSRLAYVHSPATGTRLPTPVIFLHGGPGTPHEGLPYGTAELNAAGYDVYSYDQIGAGRSTRLKDVAGYTVARNVADLEAVRTAVKADRVILIGQSWGGSLAAQYLAAHPDRVEKVAFTSPGEIWPKAHPETEVSPWNRLTGPERKRYDALVSAPRFLLQAVLLGLNPRSAHALVGDAEADSRLHEIALTGRGLADCAGGPEGTAHKNPQGFYTNQLTNADFDQIPDPRPVLRNLRTPALVLRAQCDYVPWVDTREYRDTLPGATLVYVPGAGHGITSQAGPAYLNTILRFLAGQPLTAYRGTADPAE